MAVMCLSFLYNIMLCHCLLCRYFGSAEGSKFVEMASVDNVKRTWVNYGIPRDWIDPVQGQVIAYHAYDDNHLTTMYNYVKVWDRDWLL